MKGSIIERSPGHFAIILDVRDPETGRRKRRWHSFKGTKRQADDECARLVTELNGGTYVDPSRLTVAVFLDKWLEHISTLVAPRTHERYGEIARQNIAPLLGSIMLTKLQPASRRPTRKPSPAGAGMATAAYPRERFTTSTGYCVKPCIRP